MSVKMQQLPPVPGANLMGLEKEGYSAFPGVSTFLEIPMSANGKFNLGLEKDPDLKSEFERHFGMSFDSPEGLAFLDNYLVEIKHDFGVYDPDKNVEHKFILQILKANRGMGIVAESLEQMDDSAMSTYKFFLTDEQKDLEARVDKKQIKIEAFEALSKLNKGAAKRLLSVAKYIFPAGSGIGNNKIFAFDKLEEFISSSTENAQKFIRIVNMDVDYIYVVNLVKEAIYRGIIRQGQDNNYFLVSSGTKLGRTEEEVMDYCLKPANRDIVGFGNKDDLPYSLAAQLKDFED